MGVESVGHARRRVGAMAVVAFAVIAATVAIGASDWAVGCSIADPVDAAAGRPELGVGGAFRAVESSGAEDLARRIDDPAVKVAFVGTLASVVVREPSQWKYGMPQHADWYLHFAVDRVAKGEGHEAHVVAWGNVCFPTPPYEIGHRYVVLAKDDDPDTYVTDISNASVAETAYAAWHEPLPGSNERSWWRLDRWPGRLALGLVVLAAIGGIVLVRRRRGLPATG